MMTDDEIIAVVTAKKNGKKIQCYWHGAKDGEWSDWFIGWNFNNYDYRVKPEPLEIEVWVIEDDNYIEIARSYHDPSHYKGWKKKKFREVIE